MKEEPFESVLRFIHDVGRIKSVIRTGWREKVGIEKPESVADHMYRTAVISMIISDLEGFDTEKVLRMALLHDLAEAFTGDLTPTQKEIYTPSNFMELEEEAIRKILSNLPENLSNRYLSIWREMQDSESEEAKLVRSVDKLEMAIQAKEYIGQGYAAERLDEFITSAEFKIQNSKTLQLLKILKKRPKPISST
ncbi:MAG: HD domain-containing protein [Candidatus Bathyarchaeia archaeon]|nr:HD domain-containing protein [Candidatus Bathyarchaeota archaeon]